MAKQGMKRYYPDKEKNEVPPVPEISGKAKSGKRKAAPLIPGASGKVYHTVPHSKPDSLRFASSAIDNDLAIENMENDFDMTAADLQDFGKDKT